MESPIELSSELRNFVRENIVMIRSKSLRVQSLEEVESIYKRSAINIYGLDPNSTWEDIKESYFKDLEEWLGQIPDKTKNEKKERINEMKILLKAELRRYMLAKFLQLNKFTATAEEVTQELDRIQLEIES